MPPARPSVPPAGGAKPPQNPSGARPRASGTWSAPAGSKVNEAYQDLLQEIVEKKKIQAEIRRRPPKKKKGPVIKAVLAVILPPCAAAVWILQPFANVVEPSGPPPDEREAWQMALTDAALQIRDWHDSTGFFPPDLQNAGVALDGVAYRVTGPDEFVLERTTAGGPVAVYMNGQTVGLGTPPLPLPAVDTTPLPPTPGALQ